MANTLPNTKYLDYNGLQTYHTKLMEFLASRNAEGKFVSSTGETEVKNFELVAGLDTKLRMDQTSITLETLDDSAHSSSRLDLYVNTDNQEQEAFLGVGSTGIKITESDGTIINDATEISSLTVGGNRVITVADFDSSIMFIKGDGNNSVVLKNSSNIATGENAVAEGANNTASGKQSHAEGYNNIASGNRSHAEGYNTKAIKQATHAEGRETEANVENSHAEGYQSKTNAAAAHAEGYITIASGKGSHAEGFKSNATAESAHAEGGLSYEYSIKNISLSSTTTSIDTYQYIFNPATFNSIIVDWCIEHKSPINSIIEIIDPENNNIIGYEQVHVIDYNLIDNIISFDGPLSNNEFKDVHFAFSMQIPGEILSIASGDASHAENASEAIGYLSHSEGDSYAIGDKSHAEGQGSKSYGMGSHVEGDRCVTTPIAAYSHAEGHFTVADNIHAHAEGTNTKASGRGSHAEGYNSLAKGDYSHAGGGGTIASGKYSHAGGLDCVSSGYASIAMGSGSNAESAVGVAIGDHITVSNKAESSFGKYNKSTTDTLFSIGNGTSDNKRKNAFEITKDSGYLHDKQIATVDDIPTSITVDTVLDTNSNNPIANSVVANAIRGGVHFRGVYKKLPDELHGYDSEYVDASWLGTDEEVGGIIEVLGRRFYEGDIIIVSPNMEFGETDSEFVLEEPTKEYILTYADDAIDKWRWVELGDVTPAQNMINESLKNYYKKSETYKKSEVDSKINSVNFRFGNYVPRDTITDYTLDEDSETVTIHNQHAHSAGWSSDLYDTSMIDIKPGEISLYTDHQFTDNANEIDDSVSNTLTLSAERGLRLNNNTVLTVDSRGNLSKSELKIGQVEISNSDQQPNYTFNGRVCLSHYAEEFKSQFFNIVAEWDGNNPNIVEHPETGESFNICKFVITSIEWGDLGWHGSSDYSEEEWNSMVEEWCSNVEDTLLTNHGKLFISAGCLNDPDTDVNRNVAWIDDDIYDIYDGEIDGTITVTSPLFLKKLSKLTVNGNEVLATDDNGNLNKGKLKIGKTPEWVKEIFDGDPIDEASIASAASYEYGDGNSVALTMNDGTSVGNMTIDYNYVSDEISMSQQVLDGGISQSFGMFGPKSVIIDGESGTASQFMQISQPELAQCIVGSSQNSNESNVAGYNIDHESVSIQSIATRYNEETGKSEEKVTSLLVTPEGAFINENQIATIDMLESGDGSSILMVDEYGVLTRNNLSVVNVKGVENAVFQSNGFGAYYGDARQDASHYGYGGLQVSPEGDTQIVSVYASDSFNSETMSASIISCDEGTTTIKSNGNNLDYGSTSYFDKEGIQLASTSINGYCSIVLNEGVIGIGTEIVGGDHSVITLSPESINVDTDSFTVRDQQVLTEAHFATTDEINQLKNIFA